MLSADINFSDVFWSMLWFFFLIIWIMILLNILADLFRDHSLSGWAKTIWVVFLVFLPFLAVLVYLIVRGGGMAKRSLAHQQQAQEQFADYVNTVGGGGADPANQIANAKKLLDAGAIDQDEFGKLKAKALG